MPDYIIRATVAPRTEGSTPTTIERLVRANNEARAVAHVVKDTMLVKRATIDDAIRLSKSGVEMEVAE